MRKNSGIALIELLAAASVFVVATVSMFQVWRLCFGISDDARDTAVAGQIARRELEQYKALGFYNVQVGTLSASNTGTWTASTKYFDRLATVVAENAEASKKTFSVVATGTDDRVLASSDGKTYSLDFNSLRTILVKVTRVSDSKVMYTMATQLTRGGL